MGTTQTTSTVEHAANIVAKYLLKRYSWDDIIALCESELFLSPDSGATQLANNVLYSEGITGSKIRRRTVQFSQCEEFSADDIAAQSTEERDAETEALACSKIRAILGSEFSDAIALGYSLRDCAELGVISSKSVGSARIQEARALLSCEFE